MVRMARSVNRWDQLRLRLPIYDIHAARRLPQASSKLLSPASLRVQACNDKYCLAPATVSVPIDTLRR